MSKQVWNVLYVIRRRKLACLSFFSKHCKAAVNSPRPLISDSTDFRGSSCSFFSKDAANMATERLYGIKVSAIAT